MNFLCLTKIQEYAKVSNKSTDGVGYLKFLWYSFQKQKGLYIITMYRENKKIAVHLWLHNRTRSVKYEPQTKEYGSPCMDGSNGSTNNHGWL